MAGEVTSHPYLLPGPFTITQHVIYSGGDVPSTTKNVTVTSPTATNPLIRGSSSATNGAPGDLTITLPSIPNVVVGDMFIVIVSQRASNPTVTVPSGWTLAGHVFDATQFISHHIWYRIVTAQGQTNNSPTVTSTSSGALVGTMYAIQSGTYSSSYPIMLDPFGWWTATSTTTTVPSVTTTAANTLQITQVARLNNDVIPAITASTGWVVDSKWDSSTSAALGSPVPQNLIGIAEHKVLTAAGASATATVNTPGGNSNVWSGVEIIVSPASVTASTPALAGDPGAGKSYISWNGWSDTNYTTDWTAEQTRIKNISYVKNGVTKAADTTRTGGIYVDYRAGIEGAGSPTYAFGGASTTSRSIVQSGRIYMKILEWTPAEAALYLANDPTYVAFVNAIITNMNQCKTLGYTGTFWISLCNEPSVNLSTSTSAERANIRAAHRKLYGAVKITGGVTNVAFVSPINQQGDYANAFANWNGGAPTGSGVYKNWWEWHPDWNGQFNGWTDGYTPNRNDFKIGYTNDTATTRTVDIFGLTATCTHAAPSNHPATNIWTWTTNPTATTWTNTIYERHSPFSSAKNSGFTGTDRHSMDVRGVLDILYGTSVAPIMYTEFRYPTFERSGSDPLLPESLAHWDFMLSDMIAAHVKAVVYYRSNFTTIPPVTADSWSLGAKFVEGGQTADASDIRRKGIANWLDSSYAKKV